MLNLTTKTFFNFLSTHFVDDFARYSASAPAMYIQRYNTTEFERKYNNNAPFSIKDTNNIIMEIFKETNPIECGENAITFIEYIKSNKTKYVGRNSLFSEELITLCTNTITTTDSANLVIDETTNSQTSINSTSENNTTTAPLHSTTINNSSFVEALSGLSNDLKSQIKLFMLNSMPISVKDEHYQELEVLLKQKITTKNALTVNKSYNTNKIIQKSINQNNFPSPYLSSDPVFVDSFNKLIQQFQVQIQEFNIKYLEDKLVTINTSVNEKINFIKHIDHNATDKCNSLETIIVNSEEKSLTKSIEKVQRRIKESNESTPQKNTLNVETNQKPKQNPKSRNNSIKPRNSTSNNANSHGNTSKKGSNYTRNFVSQHGSNSNNYNNNRNYNNLNSHDQYFNPRDNSNYQHSMNNPHARQQNY